MSGPGSRLWLFAACASALLLAACSDSADDAQSAKPSSKSAAPKVPSVVENMVAAVAAGKSSSALSVHFRLGNAPAVNTALPVDVVLLPHQDFTSVRARFDAHTGLTMMSGDSLAPLSKLKAEAPIEHKLVLMPQKEGVFMITANVETEGADGMVSRIFYIPVIVSPSQAPAEPAQAPAAPAAPAPN
jgi:hypothetical protein